MTQLFSEILLAAQANLNPSELRVAQYISNNRHHALHASAHELAAKSETSDATVVRAAKSLGFCGLAALRRTLAIEMEAGVPPANRVEWTVDSLGGNLEQVFEETLDLHQSSLAQLKASLPKEAYCALITHILSAKKVVIFGIGPSAAMADYLATQLRRFGISASVFSHSGLLLADEMMQLQKDDFVLLLAYGHIYKEVEVLLDHALIVEAKTAVITDMLKDQLCAKVSVCINIPTGPEDGFLMHTATLAFIEAILVGVASCASDHVITNLKVLSNLRGRLVKHKK